METHVVSHAPSQPSCGLAVWRPRALLIRQHQQLQPSLLPIVRDSCFCFDSGYRVDAHLKRTNLAAACRATGFVSLGPCKWGHHRTLLKQVHLLCFHACYGFAP
jgi:hypothetical protein